jgi:hypothetical protein
VADRLDARARGIRGARTDELGTNADLIKFPRSEDPPATR